MMRTLIVNLNIFQYQVTYQQLGFGRRPQHNSNFSQYFFLVRFKLSDILKISLLASLILEIAMKKT